MNIETLKELLSYSPDSGDLIWRHRSPKHFCTSKVSPEVACRAWNARHAGSPALGSLNGNGYMHGHINGKGFYRHTVAFTLGHGRWPDKDIDHINGCKTDNSLANLRDVSRSKNNKNRAIHSNNKSGVCGVSLCARSGRWYAYIKSDGKMKNLGLFKEKNDAIEARINAQKRLGFTERHGV